jgi:hypothetical protein
VSGAENRAPPHTTASRVGFWAAVLTTLLTIVAFAIAVATPPRSGPFCNFDSCVTSPYTDIGDYFPRDYLWMVPATLLLLPFVVLMACLHEEAGDDRKPFSLVGLSFAAMSVTVLAADYLIQLTVIQPSVVRGETDGLSLISQYNPHGVFIALEELGYTLMSVALLAIAAVVTERGGVARALRWLLVAAFTLTALAFVVLRIVYGTDIEYRFEVAVIAINWTALIVVGVLLSIRFRRADGQGTP